MIVEHFIIIGLLFILSCLAIWCFVIICVLRDIGGIIGVKKKNKGDKNG